MKTTRKSPPPPERGDRHSLSYQLREIVDSRGLSAYAVGTMAEVAPEVVSRFLRGERDIRLETADRIAKALGLRLTEVGTTKGRGPRRSVAPLPRSTPAEPPGAPESDAGDSGQLT